jgi:hypothetical protein
MPVYPSASITLAAGPLTLLFNNGMIRRICYGETEIVRRVYMALRDQYWNTIPCTVNNLTVDRDDLSFSLHFDAVHGAPGIDFSWHGTITGSASGEITLTMRGRARTDFLRSRIGWCILHPLPLCKDAPCTIGHTGGIPESARFPGAAFSPHQPFLDVRTLSYRVDDETDCTLRFTGDLFETEDQRNWTDASFKTYGTPLALPTPVELAAGTVIEQSVSIALSGTAIRRVLAPEPLPTLDVRELFDRCGRPPSIGLTMPANPAALSRSIDPVNRLGVQHLHFDIDPAGDNLEESINSTAQLCSATGATAEIALLLSSNWPEELQSVARAAGGNKLAACRIALLPNNGSVTPPELITDARRTLSPVFPHATFVAGTSRYFVEINRNRLPPGMFDALCFSVTPQVHTADNHAIIENLEGFAECIRYARALANGKPVQVSPLTLRPRFDPQRPHKSGGADERQQSLFAAAWLAGALAAATEERLDYLTCFSAVRGPEGIMNVNGELLFPLYQVLASGILSARLTAARLWGRFGPSLAAIAGLSDTGQWLLIVNLSDSPQTIRLRGVRPESTIAMLDETTISAASCDPLFWEHNEASIGSASDNAYPLNLQPYAVARLQSDAR